MPFDVDLTGFEELLNAADDLDLSGLAGELAEAGERDAKARLDMLIYSTEQRGGYVRTGKLRDSVYSDVQTDADGFTLGLGAVGGARGRKYAAFNEEGTYASRRSLDDLLREARASDSPLDLPAGARGQGGLESRPFIAPALAQAENDLGGKVLGAIDKLAR